MSTYYFDDGMLYITGSLDSSFSSSTFPFDKLDVFAIIINETQLTIDVTAFDGFNNVIGIFFKVFFQYNRITNTDFKTKHLFDNNKNQIVIFHAYDFMYPATMSYLINGGNSCMLRTGENVPPDMESCPTKTLTSSRSRSNFGSGGTGIPLWLIVLVVILVIVFLLTKNKKKLSLFGKFFR